MESFGTTDVYLSLTKNYDGAELKQHLQEIIASAKVEVTPGSTVLLKPNFVTFANSQMSCTNPFFIKAVCEIFLDLNARVSIGDSPAFGSTKRISGGIGLSDMLKGLPVDIVNFTKGPRIQLSKGGYIQVASEAVEADLMINLPKLKAHSQLGLTASVKNYFGCVVGTKKAVMHAKYGEVENLFESLIFDVMTYFQPSFNLLDGIEIMNVTGPVYGKPAQLNLIAGSWNPVALDSVVYTLADKPSSCYPLALEAKTRNLPGHHVDQVFMPMMETKVFDKNIFSTPDTLRDVSFSPAALAKSAIKRLWKKYV
tara:strand:- start:508 stop:1440 length:933 start_codon:yes stop_codon:yes gene_type:complete